jgi:abequosyltransferase
MSTKLISVCIPSFNRPRELGRLLDSIDCRPESIEIVISEDCAPRQKDVRNKVSKYTSECEYEVRYFENEVNLGFDGNLRRLVSLAEGKYVLFMGDDDLFVPGMLDQYINFLASKSPAYVLRSYLTVHANGHTEEFRYLPQTKRLDQGEETVAWLFKRSVTICGFTIDRPLAQRASTSDLDGTLLYQVYLMSEACLAHESYFCGIPFVHAVQTYREDKPMFGFSAAERSRYTPGTVSQENSINFTAAYFEVSSYLDEKHGTNLTVRLRKDLSRYSYPFLSIQRKNGIEAFLNYAGRLETELGFGCTPYFYFYKWSLVFFGERWCDRVIIMIKRILGHTPQLR